MSKRANPTLIGVFVLGAAALALGAILVFGSGKFFQERNFFTIHFDQSLMGLSIGSPVIFQGVQVGSVVDIHAAFTQLDPPVIQTPATIELIEGIVKDAAGVKDDMPASEMLKLLIDNGLRARLDILSLVTNQLYVELVFAPETPVVYMSADTSLTEIPSIASDQELFMGALRTAAKEFKEVPFDEIVKRVTSILDGMDGLVNSAKAQESLTRLDEVLTESRDLVRSLDGKVDSVYTELMDTTNQAKLALASADKALTDAGRLIEPGSPLGYEVQATLEEVRRSTRRLGTLVDELSRRPDSVIFGRGERGESP